MSLDSLRESWDTLAATDPWRAILGRPGEGKPWDAEEFFATGVWEVEEILRYAETLDLPGQRRTALDFGCGAGRVTQALAPHFDKVTGADISPAMLELAARHNRHGERCRYVLIDTAELSGFPKDSFDLVYSNITLQHMAPAFATGYIRELLRVLAPRGLLLFYLPSHRRRPWLARLLPGNLYTDCGRVLRRIVHPGRPLIEMHSVHYSKVTDLVATGGGRVLDRQGRFSKDASWADYRYAVTK